MNWYYELRGIHVHVRVFMNGGKCGDLVFRKEEFVIVREQLAHFVKFFNEGPDFK